MAYKFDPAAHPRDPAADEAERLSYIAQCEHEARQPRRDTLPHYPVETELEPFGVKAHVSIAVKRFFADVGRKLTTKAVLRVTCGAGKTWAAIQEAVAFMGANQEGRIEFAVPTIAKAEELAQDIIKAGATNVFVVQGKTADNCERFERIQASRRLKIRHEARAVCARCPLRDECEYLAQRDAAGGAGIVIYTHAALSLSRPSTWRQKPDALIIDEAPPATRIETWSLKLLGRGKTEGERTMLAALAAGQDKAITDLATLAGRACAGDQARRVAALKIVTGVLKSHSERIEEILEGLARISGSDDERTAAKWARFAAAIQRHEAWAEIAGAMSDNLRAGQSVMRVRQEGDLIKTMRMATRTRMSWTASKRPGQDLGEISPLPVLLLDGTADRGITETFFGKVRWHQIDARLNADIIQIIDSMCSTYTMLTSEGAENWQREMIDVAARKAKAGKKVLLIASTKALAEELKKRLEGIDLGAGCIEVIHAGGVRGLNCWEDFDVGILVGLTRPDIVAAEDEAIALHGEISMLPGTADRTRGTIEDLNDRHMKHRGYRMNDGSLFGVAIPVHPDPRVQAIWEQMSSAVVVQALHRLRIVHTRDSQGNPRDRKELIIGTKMPLDITVTHLSKRRDLPARAEDLAPNCLAGALARSGGAIALTADDLFDSGAYPSRRAARVCATTREIRDAAKAAAEALGAIKHSESHQAVPADHAGALVGEVSDASLIDILRAAALTPSEAGMSTYLAVASIKDSKGGRNPVVLIQAPEDADTSTLLTRWQEAGHPALADLTVVARLDFALPAQVIEIDRAAGAAIVEKHHQDIASQIQARRDQEAAQVRDSIARSEIRERELAATAEKRAQEIAEAQEVNAAIQAARQERTRKRLTEIISGNLSLLFRRAFGSVDRGMVWLSATNTALDGQRPLDVALHDYNVLSHDGAGYRRILAMLRSAQSA